MSYNYDQASHLAGISYQMGSTNLGNLTYAYDNDGRRVSMGGSFARTGLPQAVSLATYDAANELTQWGTANLTYDLDGNLTSDGVNTYTWNARNQLASDNAGGTNFNFAYDAFGRRVQNAMGNQLLYDGANAVQELSGGTPVANRLTGGIDEFFSRTDSSGTFSPLTDALGSTVALTDSTGAVQTQYTYEPFGTTTTTGPANANPYQFTGRENDGTGLYYYRARSYSPIYQRFISEDRTGFAGSGVNLYAYAGDNPVAFSDPSGLHWSINWPWGGGGGNGGGNPQPGQQPNPAPNPNPPQPNPKPYNEPPCQDPAAARQEALNALFQYISKVYSLPGFEFYYGTALPGPSSVPITSPTADLPGVTGVFGGVSNGLGVVDSAGQVGNAMSSAFNNDVGSGCTPQ